MPLSPVSFVVKGNLVSMKNSRRIVRRGRWKKLAVIKSQSALDYSDAFIAQIPKSFRKLNIKSPVSLSVIVWYSSARPDLDVELVKDLLQRGGILSNDRLVHEQYSRKFIDKNDPRVFVTVSPLIPRSALEVNTSQHQEPGSLRRCKIQKTPGK